MLHSTQFFRNYGLRSTSRREQQHHSIKKNIKNRLITLFQLERSISVTVEEREAQFKSQLAKEKISRLGKYARVPLLADLCTKISFKAPDLLYSQYSMAYAVFQDLGKIPPPSLPPCSGQFRTQMGLPCRHEILSRLETVEPLKLDDCDAHWDLGELRVRSKPSFPCFMAIY